MGNRGNPSPPGWHQNYSPRDRNTRCQAGSCCNQLHSAAGRWRHVPLGSGHRRLCEPGDQRDTTG
eukprot:jgi/Astpho2/3482/gw1.00056.46.1_t